jgi:hypothetical protein
MTEITKLKKNNEKLHKMLEEERNKVKGYEELARIHNAYIAITLKKMGATSDNPIPIINDEIKEAMEHYEVRAVVGDDGSWKFYCDER